MALSTIAFCTVSCVDYESAIVSLLDLTAKRFFFARPRDETMADSESTQEMLQNAMVESSVGAR